VEAFITDGKEGVIKDNLSQLRELRRKKQYFYKVKQECRRRRPVEKRTYEQVIAELEEETEILEQQVQRDSPLIK